MRARRVVVRPLRTHEEFHEAERIQKIVWRYSDREIVPLTEMVVAQKIGGMVIGAFAGRRMIGFCFGVPGFRDGKVFHHSRMLGVLPGRQNRGLGMRMKLYQRRFVRRQGIDTIQWTFDPLQSRNANLNIGKLGCVVRHYLINVYGANSSVFNRGVETDRVIAEWRTERGERRKEKGEGRREKGEGRRGKGERRREKGEGDWEPGKLRTINRTRRNARGFREMVSIARNIRGGPIAVEIPGDFDALKAASLPLARRWRAAMRAILQRSFREGFVITGFRSMNEAEGRRCFYLLERGVE